MYSSSLPAPSPTRHRCTWCTRTRRTQIILLGKTKPHVSSHTARGGGGGVEGKDVLNYVHIFQTFHSLCPHRKSLGFLCPVSVNGFPIRDTLSALFLGLKYNVSNKMPFLVSSSPTSSTWRWVKKKIYFLSSFFKIFFPPPCGLMAPFKKLCNKSWKSGMELVVWFL